MRKIKFKAWDGKKVCKVLALKFTFENGVLAKLEGHDDKWTTIKFERLMQLTTFKDKNGTEIYEGNLVAMTCNCGNCKDTNIGAIVHKLGITFWIDGKNPEKEYLIGAYLEVPGKEKTIEVVGTIYEKQLTDKELELIHDMKDEPFVQEYREEHE